MHMTENLNTMPILVTVLQIKSLKLDSAVILYGKVFQSWMAAIW